MDSMIIDAELNRKILKLAPKLYNVRDNAPDTFEALKASQTSGLVVYSGASENTIYGDPSINHAFRAWHDALHLKLGADFTTQGEKMVGLEQARIIGSDIHAELILAEVNAQVDYFERYGEFPANQLEFINNLVFKK